MTKCTFKFSHGNVIFQEQQTFELLNNILNRNTNVVATEYHVIAVASTYFQRAINCTILSFLNKTSDDLMCSRKNGVYLCHKPRWLCHTIRNKNVIGLASTTWIP